ncbi:MAG TPA: Hsp20 family protein, partial [Polyangiaceae bacterium]
KGSPFASILEYSIRTRDEEDRSSRSSFPELRWQPLADVVISREVAQIRFELAGVAETQLEVRVLGKVVRVFGHRPAPELGKEQVGLGYLQAEILYGAFERSIELPWRADPERVRIVSRAGLLLVELERQEPSAERDPDPQSPRTRDG